MTMRRDQLEMFEKVKAFTRTKMKQAKLNPKLNPKLKHAKPLSYTLNRNPKPYPIKT